MYRFFCQIIIFCIGIAFLLQSGCKSTDSVQTKELSASSKNQNIDIEKTALNTPSPSHSEPLFVMGTDGNLIANPKAKEFSDSTSSDSLPTETSTNNILEMAETSDITQDVVSEKNTKKRSREKKTNSDSVESDTKLFIVKTNQNITLGPTQFRMQKFYDELNKNNRKKAYNAYEKQLQKDPQVGSTSPLENAYDTTNLLGEVIQVVETYETKIQFVNEELQFVVLDYSFRSMPPLEQRMNVLREGKNIGLIKITGPVKDGSIVAIIIEGSPQKGDTVIREIW